MKDYQLTKWGDPDQMMLTEYGNNSREVWLSKETRRIGNCEIRSQKGMVALFRKKKEAA